MIVEDQEKTQRGEDILYMNGWFDQRYRNALDKHAYILKLVVNRLFYTRTKSSHQSLGERFYTFKQALNWILQHDGRHIVETGSMREPGNWFGVGCSTYLFGDFVSRYGGHLWTCDLSKEVIQTAREETQEFHEQISYVNSDSVRFLDEFEDIIDLLYLDSADCPRNGDATNAQHHNLRELQTAIPKLSRDAVVLLDDNRFDNGGKTRMSKQYLQDNGWICLFDWYQSLWTKRRS